MENHSLNSLLSFKYILPSSLDVYAEFQNDYVPQLLYPLTMEYYSATKRNKIGSFCSDVDEPRICQCEVSQKDLLILYINAYISI